jgi:MerR family transcriptional regulator, light-induced transcriptional regulator
MHPLYPEFIAHLDRLHKEACVQFVVANLHNKALDIVTLYHEILTPALQSRGCEGESQPICIWEEHVRTSIVRTIIECCYLFVIRERAEKYRSSFKGKVAVVCPPGELHEIGPRMVADFFTLCGFNAIFVGANTPAEDIMGAIRYIKPQYVAISITNYYNLVATRTIVRQILGLKESMTLSVILGGQACRNNPETCRQLSPDLMLDSFAEIQRLSEGARDAAA